MNWQSTNALPRPRKTHSAYSLLFATLFLTGISATGLSAEAAPKTVTSIAPIHSIAAYIMGDTGSPEVIVPPLASPHHFSLKPSQAQTMEAADLVIWVGPELETFLEKPLESIATKADTLQLLDLPNLTLLEPGNDEHKDDHDDENYDEHKDEHAHEHKDENHSEEAKHDDHADHDDHKEDGDGHDDHKEHAESHDDHDHSGGKDPHIWLNTSNAKIIAQAISAELSKKDEANAETYRKNLSAFESELDQLKSDIGSKLSGLSGSAFLVYHDAYRYFESEFGLQSAGVFAINPELKPGAKKLKDLVATLEEKKIKCIFSEPQFDTKPISLLMDEQPGLNIKIGELDPLGGKFKVGPNHYFETMKAMAQSFADCLK